MKATERRYDIDWLRVIAIALLLIYHAAIVFQPWGALIGFITSQESILGLWIPMAMLNVWRIPLLFFVSGMGMAFAMRRRNVKEIIMERFQRILIPLLFGMVIIVPIHIYIWQTYYNQTPTYEWGRGHLWFLANIFMYVLMVLPIVYAEKRFLGTEVKAVIKKVMGNPFGILVVLVPFIVEVFVIKPVSFELYAMTWHGFFLGFIAFTSGFVMIKTGQQFWNMLKQWWWSYLLLAIGLYTARLLYYQLNGPSYLKCIESVLWIYSFMGVGYRYLNKPSRVLAYLSQSAYPVYILHMVFLYWGATLILPLIMPVIFKYFLVTTLSLLGSFIVYELIIRRVPFIGLFFGLKGKKDHKRVQENLLSKTGVKCIG